MAHKKPHKKTRYESLVAAFSASAFALLLVLTAQMQSANTATASVASHSTVLMDYRRAACVTSKKGNAHLTQEQSRLLNKACSKSK